MRSYYILVSIAVESFGLWGPRELKFIREMGRKIKEETGNKYATSRYYENTNRGHFDYETFQGV